MSSAAEARRAAQGEGSRRVDSAGALGCPPDGPLSAVDLLSLMQSPEPFVIPPPPPGTLQEPLRAHAVCQEDAPLWRAETVALLRRGLLQPGQIVDRFESLPYPVDRAVVMQLRAHAAPFLQRPELADEVGDSLGSLSRCIFLTGAPLPSPPSPSSR